MEGKLQLSSTDDTLNSKSPSLAGGGKPSGVNLKFKLCQLCDLKYKKTSIRDIAREFR